MTSESIRLRLNRRKIIKKNILIFLHFLSVWFAGSIAVVFPQIASYLNVKNFQKICGKPNNVIL